MVGSKRLAKEQRSSEYESSRKKTSVHTHEEELHPDGTVIKRSKVELSEEEVARQKHTKSIELALESWVREQVDSRERLMDKSHEYVISNSVRVANMKKKYKNISLSRPLQELVQQEKAELARALKKHRFPPKPKLPSSSPSTEEFGKQRWAFQQSVLKFACDVLDAEKAPLTKEFLCEAGEKMEVCDFSDIYFWYVNNNLLYSTTTHPFQKEEETRRLAVKETKKAYNNCDLSGFLIDGLDPEYAAFVETSEKLLAADDLAHSTYLAQAYFTLKCLLNNWTEADKTINVRVSDFSDILCKRLKDRQLLGPVYSSAKPLMPNGTGFQLAALQMEAFPGSGWIDVLVEMPLVVNAFPTVAKSINQGFRERMEKTRPNQEWLQHTMVKIIKHNGCKPSDMDLQTYSKFNQFMESNSALEQVFQSSMDHKTHIEEARKQELHDKFRDMFELRRFSF